MFKTEIFEPRGSYVCDYTYHGWSLVRSRYITKERALKFIKALGLLPTPWGPLCNKDYVVMRGSDKRVVTLDNADGDYAISIWIKS